MKLKRLVGLKKKLVGVVLACGMVQFQLGGCSLGQITTTTTTTLDGEVVLTSLLRSLIITPIDEALTAGIAQLIDNLNDDD
jgi:hypothetical protein